MYPDYIADFILIFFSKWISPELIIIVYLNKLKIDCSKKEFYFMAKLKKKKKTKNIEITCHDYTRPKKVKFNEIRVNK